jgi:enoyl-CoA hydratase/carnithine racemase
VSGLEYSITDRVGLLTLNRPERRNAFTLEMIDQWAEILREARSDDSVHVVLVTGSGGAFCAGVDLDDFAAQRTSTLADKQLLSDRVHRVAVAMQDLDKPVLAAVDGVAVGAGMDIALMCDIRLATTAARFSQGYVKVGLVPGDGGCWLLPRVVGMARALELMWTGDFVGGEEAHRIGLVNHLYEDAEALQAAATELAGRLAGGPQVALRMIKRASYQGATMELRAALDLISSHQAVVQSTEESQAAMAAFRAGKRSTSAAA